MGEEPSAPPLCRIGKIIVWNWAKQQITSPPMIGHNNMLMARVTSIAFSHDGKMLASNGGGTTILWGVDHGQRLGQVSGKELSNLAFSDDNNTLISDKEPIDISLESFRKNTCKIANRNLSKEEWLNYVGNTEAYQETCSDILHNASPSEITSPDLQSSDINYLQSDDAADCTVTDDPGTTAEDNGSTHGHKRKKKPNTTTFQKKPLAASEKKKEDSKHNSSQPPSPPPPSNKWSIIKHDQP
jgi:hypothetical protein